MKRTLATLAVGIARKRTLLILLAGLALALTGSAGAWHSNVWVSPSRNIVCRYYTYASTVRCMTRSDGFTVSLSSTGYGRHIRDWAVYPPQRSYVLWYGESWSNDGGTVCVSRRDGMVCTNRAEHGFLINRLRYRLW
jgi:hypothetical protein